MPPENQDPTSPSPQPSTSPGEIPQASGQGQPAPQGFSMPQAQPAASGVPPQTAQPPAFPSQPNLNVPGQNFDPPTQPAPPAPQQFSQQYAAQQPSLPTPQFGGQTGQPQQPVPDMYQNYQDQMPQYAPPKAGKRILMAVLLLTGLLLLAGAAAFAYTRMQTTPDSAFKGAVENSLSTAQVRQEMTAEQGTAEVLYDLSREKDPRVYVRTKADFLGLNIDMEQYATTRDGYVKYQDYLRIFEPGDPLEKFKGKWMQERKNGTTLEGNGLFPAAYVHLFGDWIFGNFSDKDRHDIKNYILTEKVYEYDAAKVEKKTLDGKEVYAYSIKVDSKKRLELNKKVAAIWGVDAAAVEKDIKSFTEPGKTTLYVDIKTKRLVQVDAEDEAMKVVNKYTDYNSVSMPSQPKVEASYEEFTKVVR